MRFLNVILTSSLGLSLLYCGQGVAAPLAYSAKDKDLIINNRTTSTVLADSESSRIGWVLPPTGGTVEPKGFLPSANLGFCPGVKELQKTSNTIIKRIGEYSDKFAEMNTNITEEFRLLQEIDLKISKLPKASDIDEQITRKDESILRLLGEINEIKADLTKTKDEADKEINLKRNEIATVKNEIEMLFIKKRQVRQLESQKASIKEEYEALSYKQENILNRIQQLRSIVDNIYGDRAKIEGGHVFVDYNFGWEENMQKLKLHNPHYDFKQIPTKNTRVFANFIAPDNKESYSATLPLLIDYSIAGINYIHWGKPEGVSLNSLPNIINGDFRLNLLGACPIHDKNFFDINSNDGVKRGNDGYPVFGIHATYDYPIVYKFKVHAEYNLYRVYEEIKKRTEKNGFFSRKNFTELIQNKMDSDTMKISIDDEGTSITDEKRLEMLALVKNDIMNKALSGMAEPVPGVVTNKDLELPQGQSGAIVIANGFNRFCGFYNTCWVAGWILRGADSIWGSREAETRFKSEYHKTIKFDWSMTNPAFRSSSTGFERTKTI